MKHRWYKRSPSDFITGCIQANMNAEQIGAYAIILDLLYDKGQPIDNDPKWLGGLLNIPTRRARTLIAELIEKGKIFLTEDGRIDNGRANSARSFGQKTPEKTAETNPSVGPKQTHLIDPVSNESSDLAAKKGALRAQGLESRSQNLDNKNSIPSKQSSSGAETENVVSLENDLTVRAKTACIEFRNLESEIFGRPPRGWHHTDLAVAKKWLEAGVTLGTVRQVLREILTRMVEAKKQPPRSLSYFSEAMMRAQAEAGFENDKQLSRQGWWLWPTFPFADYYWSAVCDAMQRQPDFHMHQDYHDAIKRAAATAPNKLADELPARMARDWMAKYGAGIKLPGRLYEATAEHQEMCHKARLQHEAEEQKHG